MNNLDAELLVPHSRESEQSIIGALLIDCDAIDRIGELRESDFFNNAHKLIFRAISKQSAAGKNWDVITIAEFLEKHGKLNEIGGLPYLGSIAQNVPSSANIGRYADIVREHAMRRSIMTAANELSQVVAKRGDILEAMDKAQSQLLAITESSVSDEPKSIGTILNEHMNTLEQRLSNERKGITTGLSELDSILNGGWHRGQLVIVAARPGMGKSALSLHNAIEAARAGYGCLYLSMEMVSAELADRALASYGRIPLRDVISADLKQTGWDGVTMATSKLHELPLHVVDRSGLNFYQVASYARRHKRKSGLDLLVVDYLQLMCGEADEKRHSQIEEITRGLKVLAKELHIAIILLSQLSRKTEDVRKPKLSHLRDSGSIEQDADVVLFIHREEVDVPETDWKNYADIHIAKNRQGALGRIGATYIGEQVRFENFGGVMPSYDNVIKYKTGGHK